MAKIVLFTPKPNENYFYQGIPLSLLAVSSTLHPEGYDIKLIKAKADHDYKAEVLESCADALVLGVSVLTGYPIKEGLEVSKAVREKYPNVKIVWGGWHPSIEPDTTIRSPYIDIVCRGQGERTFYEIVKHLESGKPLDDVLGITYKENGAVIKNPDRPVENLSQFPRLPYELLNLNEYFMKTEIGSKTVNMITSAGCPHNCRFCSEVIVYKRRWLSRTAQNVIDDLEFFYKNYGIDSVFIDDSNFFVDEARTRDICIGLLERDIKIKWGMVNGRTEQLLKFKPETWDLLIKAGLKSILVGAESGSDKMLSLIHKNATVKDTVDIVKLCKRYGVRIFISLITGYPPDPPTTDLKVAEKQMKEELQDTLDMIDAIYSVDRKHHIFLNIYTPYPGCPLYDLSIKSGFKAPQTIDEWANFVWIAGKTPWVPEKYKKLVDYLEYYIFPVVGKQFYYKIGNNYTGLKAVSLKAVARLFEGLAILRWETKFFGFPIEYTILKEGLKMKRKGELKDRVS